VCQYKLHGRDLLWCHETEISHISLCIVFLWSTSLSHFWQLESWLWFYYGNQNPKNTEKDTWGKLEKSTLKSAYPKCTAFLFFCSNLLFCLDTSKMVSLTMEYPNQKLRVPSVTSSLPLLCTCTELSSSICLCKFQCLDSDLDFSLINSP
jgi:hypothetical protein